ncbi:MAG: methyltransferase domain-containing protein [Armatimonadota bacterium]
MAEWFENVVERCWLRGDEGAEEEAQFVTEALHLRPGDAVLDAPCGAGRLALPLAKAGCRLSGIDRNTRFITRARERFAEQGLAGDFTILDLRQLVFREKFDAIFNWSGSFGYFSEEENAEVVARFAAALKPGGRLLIDQLNRENMLRHYYPILYIGDVTMHNRWNAELQRQESFWTVNEGERTREFLTLMRFYTLAQFRRLFQRAGLQLEHAYGEWDGSPYHRARSRRLVVVAKK